MLYRMLGNTGIEVSAIGFGCSRIASLTTRYSRREVVATLKAALDQGVSFFDTADVYGQGDSERLLGRVFHGSRDRVVLCTKAGLRLTAPQLAIRLVKPLLNPWLWRVRRMAAAGDDLRQRSERQCFDPRWLRARLASSLRRLRTDYVDLFLLHNPPPHLGELDAVLALLEKLRVEGSIRAYGVSCAELKDGHFWVGVRGIGCLQVPLDATKVSAARPLLDEVHGRGAGLIVRGIYGGERFSRIGLQALRPLHALAPLLAQPDVGTVVIGMGCRQHLAENLAALEAHVQ